MAYDVDEVVRLQTTIRNSAGALADPTTVSLEVRPPGSTVTTYTYAGGQITKASTGVYFYDLTLNESGRWYYRWLSTGTPAVVEEDELIVDRSLVNS